MTNSTLLSQLSPSTHHSADSASLHHLHCHPTAHGSRFVPGFDDEKQIYSVFILFFSYLQQDRSRGVDAGQQHPGKLCKTAVIQLLGTFDLVLIKQQLAQLFWTDANSILCMHSPIAWCTQLAQ